MPSYQYTCTDCGEPLEAVQAFTDNALTVCLRCGGSLRKIFSAVGVVFKGSGFYRTDSRKGNGKGSAAAGSSGASEKPSDGGAAPAAESGSTNGSAKNGSSGGESSNGSKQAVPAGTTPSTGGSSSS